MVRLIVLEIISMPSCGSPIRKPILNSRICRQVSTPLILWALPTVHSLLESSPKMPMFLSMTSTPTMLNQSLLMTTKQSHSYHKRSRSQFSHSLQRSPSRTTYLHQNLVLELDLKLSNLTKLTLQKECAFESFLSHWQILNGSDGSSIGNVNSATDKSENFCVVFRTAE